MTSKSIPKKIKKIDAHTDGVFDFNTVSGFTKSYLQTYYGGQPNPDEQLLIDFLVRMYPKIKGADSFLEIGCGPTIHHVIPVAPYVEHIVMADYLSENLSAVREWIVEGPDAHDWDPHILLALEREGNKNSDALTNRKNLLRKKIENLLHCDLKSNLPLGNSQTFPAVGCFYVTEEIGINEVEWQKVMERLASLVEKGGYLFLASLSKTDFYQVGIAEGEIKHYPCMYLTKSHLENVLPRLGFVETKVEEHEFQGQEGQGVPGILLLAAKKL